MKSNKITIGCHSDAGQEYPKTFEGQTAIEDAVRFFIAQMADVDFQAVKAAFIKGATEATLVGVFTTTPSKIAMEYHDEVRGLTAEGISRAKGGAA